MKRFLTVFSALMFVLFLTANSFAITWFPQEFECPIDKEKNTFMVVGSYGSYIYSYPSKYQWLFFPYTDSPTYYMCKKCHLTTYMWDFDELPKDKLADIKKVLDGVKVSKKFDKYQEISLLERLEVMEKVYKVLGKNDSWWETFYRVKGYHYGSQGETAKAAEARKASLELIKKDIANEKSESSKKLLWYISGAMKHFLGDDKGAIEDLQKAQATKFAEKGAKPEDIENGEKGLNDRVADYIEMIKSADKKPRLKETASDGHGH